MGVGGEGEGEYFVGPLLVCERWHTCTDSENFTCFGVVVARGFLGVGVFFFGDL